MEDKMLRIGGELHQQVKLAAIIEGYPTIRSWVERALRAALPDKARMLVDSAAVYEVKEESND